MKKHHQRGPWKVRQAQLFIVFPSEYTGELAHFPSEHTGEQASFPSEHTGFLFVSPSEHTGFLFASPSEHTGHPERHRRPFPSEHTGHTTAKFPVPLRSYG
jgi:hypothetical protein